MGLIPRALNGSNVRSNVSRGGLANYREKLKFRLVVGAPMTSPLCARPHVAKEERIDTPGVTSFVDLCLFWTDPSFGASPPFVELCFSMS